MAIIRNYFRENFSIIPNEIIKARDIKGNVKDLLYYFYMLPESWEPNQKHFADFLNVNIRTVERYISELKKKGYLNTVKNDKGLNTFDYVLTIPTKMSEYIPTNDDIYIPTNDIPTNYIPTKMSEHINTNTFSNTNNSNTNIINTKENIKEKIPYEQIINYLNQLTRKKFAVTDNHKKHIKARWNENKEMGFTYEENILAFQKVIQVKFTHWYSNNDMKRYLRPETLFGTKFNTYLNEEPKQITTKDFREMRKINGDDECII